MVSDEVTLFFQQWILDSTCSHYVYYREKLFDFVESREDAIHLPNGLSCAIKDEGIANFKLHDGTSMKPNEIRYISSFNKNLISLNKLDSNGYTWRVGNVILNVIHGNRVVIKGKKYRGHYFLIGSSRRGGVPSKR